MVRISIDSKKTIGTVSPELHSQFIEFLGDCIYGGIWVGPDSEIPNIRGIRKDAVEALKEAAPPVIRWPGGCYADTYHWRDGIGDPEKRPVTYNENFGTYEEDSNAFGTDEFMLLCELVGARPWLNVNMMTGTPAEMREWMEYCNRDAGTAAATERAENGHPLPYRAELWGIGNEMWGGGGNCTPESYIREYRRFASAAPSFVRLEDGRPVRGLQIRKILSGADGNKKRERVLWTKGVFEELAKFRTPPFDGMDLHFYNWNVPADLHSELVFDEAEWDSCIAGCLELEEVLQEQYGLIQEGLAGLPGPETDLFPFRKPHCDLIIGEWGNWHGAAFRNRPALYQQCCMRDAVTTALTLNLLQRNCDKVTMACAAQTFNVLNSLFLTDGDVLIRTPNFDVFRMYREERGGEAVEVKEAPEEKVFAQAVKKDGKLFVNLVNASMTEEKEVVLALSGYEAEASEILCSDDVHACNTKEKPDRVRRTAGTLPEKTPEGFAAKLPPASVQVLVFGEKEAE